MERGWQRINKNIPTQSVGKRNSYKSGHEAACMKFLFERGYFRLEVPSTYI